MNDVAHNVGAKGDPTVGDLLDIPDNID